MWVSFITLLLSAYLPGTENADEVYFVCVCVLSFSGITGGNYLLLLQRRGEQRLSVCGRAGVLALLRPEETFK